MLIINHYTLSEYLVDLESCMICNFEELYIYINKTINLYLEF